MGEKRRRIGGGAPGTIEAKVDAFRAEVEANKEITERTRKDLLDRAGVSGTGSRAGETTLGGLAAEFGLEKKGEGKFRSRQALEKRTELLKQRPGSGQTILTR